MNSTSRRIATALTGAFLALSMATAASAQAPLDTAYHAAAASRHSVWTSGWSAAPQRPISVFTPNWSQAGFSH
ncbi:hypothetical protein OIE67_21145 [Nonomuraea fuscirosea]|jgi:hypothetical protein|uniref:hypothetical protein n=1 Tax=Nonomuraea fuscirosea TaxID=1291556 RepID=UPI002DD8A244|nr:hypothetical protein [Nonomuraea fuscirosea]WSA57024.1 hypothetical protein OIE67_21145 [Nonomuraea fuscirosea]